MKVGWLTSGVAQRTSELETKEAAVHVDCLPMHEPLRTAEQHVGQSAMSASSYGGTWPQERSASVVLWPAWSREACAWKVAAEEWAAVWVQGWFWLQQCCGVPCASSWCQKSQT